MFIMVTALRGSARANVAPGCGFSPNRDRGYPGGWRTGTHGSEAAQAMLSGDGNGNARHCGASWDRTWANAAAVPSSYCWNPSMPGLTWLCLAAKASRHRQLRRWASPLIDRTLPHFPNRRAQSRNRCQHPFTSSDPAPTVPLRGGMSGGPCAESPPNCLCASPRSTPQEWFARFQRDERSSPMGKNAGIDHNTIQWAAALVMTFSHDLDFRLCLRLLARPDPALLVSLAATVKPPVFAVAQGRRRHRNGERKDW
ncbi:MAG: hypothetical protein CM1200mP41_24600 [Gammaproteobacteria bacterium]|nr:MAG: hypothetical protein CM1200mP41_24600 [Gammaproteobacteria bacterium]